MANITIADMMIALGQMQKDIDQKSADSSMWFNRFFEVENEKNKLKAQVEELQKKVDDLTGNYARMCEGTI